MWAAAVGAPAGPRPASGPAAAVAEAMAVAARAATSFGDFPGVRKDVRIRDKVNLWLAHSARSLPPGARASPPRVPGGEAAACGRGAGTGHRALGAAHHARGVLAPPHPAVNPAFT